MMLAKSILDSSPIAGSSYCGSTIFRALRGVGDTIALMSGAYHQLLDAAIQHLEELKARGVRFVPVTPETLAALSQARRVTPSM